MKMISFAVPCYNSQDYMRNCIESLLTGGDRVEILIVDDGSKDNTLQIAREYENNYPDLIRVIHKENGGHGDALMAGLAAAVCPYFKVVDSDDWVDTEALQQVLDVLETQWKKRKPIDMLIHLGDAEGSEMFIPDWVNPGCRMEMIQGNNDFFSMLDKEREITLGRHRVFLTHGHYYGVSIGPEGLADEARSRGCDIAMFGHTHKPYQNVIGGVLLLNPGSLSYPRQEGRLPAYMLVNVDDKGELTYEQKYL